MEDIAQLVIDTTGSESTIKLRKHPGHWQLVKRGDFSAIRSLGFVPKTSIEEGIVNTIDWQLSCV